MLKRDDEDQDERLSLDDVRFIVRECLNSEEGKSQFSKGVLAGILMTLGWVLWRVLLLGHI